MHTILIIIQVLIGLAMIALILVQRGTGAAAGSGFGGGASGTVFGSSGSGSFLTRTTAVLATLFLGTSLAMAVMASRTTTVDAGPDIGVMSNVQEAMDEDLPQVESAGAMDVSDPGVLNTAEPDADADALNLGQGSSEPDDASAAEQSAPASDDESDTLSDDDPS